MPESRINNTSFALSYAKAAEDTSDLLLMELNEINTINNEYKNVLSTGNLLQYSFQENKEFLYVVYRYDSSYYSRKTTYIETGVGNIYKIGSKSYLKRISSILHTDDQNKTAVSQIPLNFSQDDFLIVYNYNPTNYFELFVYPNSVICSNSLNAPVPVDLPPSSVLGRINGNVQSLNSTELRGVLTDANITNAVESSTGNYTFLCQTLNLANSNSRLSSAALQARPVYNTSNRPAPQRGSIIYNEQTNRFEGYDGTDWRPFAWASGIGPPYV